jgi:hypothetical protein
MLDVTSQQLKEILAAEGEKFIMCQVGHTMIVQLLNKRFAVLKKLRQQGLELHLDKQIMPSTY